MDFKIGDIVIILPLGKEDEIISKYDETHYRLKNYGIYRVDLLQLK